MHLGWIAAKDSILLVLAVIPTDVFVYITVVNIWNWRQPVCLSVHQNLIFDVEYYRDMT